MDISSILNHLNYYMGQHGEANTECAEAIYKDYIPRPDPAEVERLVDELIRKAIRYGQSNHTNISNHNSTQVDQARAQLLKLVGGGE
jgi:hypothetical protein